MQDEALTRKALQLIQENWAQEELTNMLVIRWGKKWSSKLGHIKPLKNEKYGSLIEINSLLKEPEVPDYVLDAVIMHELVHYFQGFGSNKQRKHKHPHRGGIVDKELIELGWGEIIQKQNKWVKENWLELLKKTGLRKRTPFEIFKQKFEFK